MSASHLRSRKAAPAAHCTSLSCQEDRQPYGERRRESGDLGHSLGQSTMCCGLETRLELLWASVSLSIRRRQQPRVTESSFWEKHPGRESTHPAESLRLCVADSCFAGQSTSSPLRLLAAGWWAPSLSHLLLCAFWGQLAKVSVMIWVGTCL